MDYQLNAGEQVVGKSMIPSLYLPANKVVEVKDACVLPFKLFYTEKLLAGKTKEEALNTVGAMWKGLSGSRPEMLSEELWKTLTATKPVMKAKGSVVTLTEKEQAISHFESEWQE